MSDSPSLARSLVSKLLFVVGVLVLLGLLAWGILKIVPKVVSGIAGVGGAVAGLFGGSALDVAVDPETVKTGTPANVSWDFPKASGDGVYSLSYECQAGVTVVLERPGSSAKTMTCGTGYSLGADSGYATVTPTLAAKTALADVNLRVAYREAGKDVASGSKLLTVTDGTGYANPKDGENAATEATVSSEKSSGSGTVQSGDGYSVKWNGGSSSGSGSTGGLANLTIGNPSISGDALIFDVRNTGGRATGPWSFNYTTPTSPSDTFQGPAMISLNPGEGLRVRVRFGEVESGSHNVTVSVDPYNEVAETSDADNVMGVTVTGSGSSNNNNNNNSHSGNDLPNLHLSSLEVGRESGSSFTEDDTITRSQDAAVRFRVRNDGDDDTGSWRYTVRVPGGDDYRSSSQSSLRPGETKTVTVNLGQLDRDTYDLKVTVDSDDRVDESDEHDNVESETLEVN